MRVSSSEQGNNIIVFLSISQLDQIMQKFELFTEVETGCWLRRKGLRDGDAEWVLVLPLYRLGLLCGSDRN